jgi:hypothetical protein
VLKTEKTALFAVKTAFFSQQKTVEKMFYLLKSVSKNRVFKKALFSTFNKHKINRL